MIWTTWRRYIAVLDAADRKPPQKIAFTVILSAVLSAGSCGGSSPSPTAATPPPVFINVTGGWSGTYLSTFNIPQFPGGPGAGACNMNVTITSQDGGQFSGTFQLTGNYANFGVLVTCAWSGPTSGSVTTTGTVTDLRVVPTIAIPGVACTYVSRSAVTGVVSPAAFNANWTEQWSCPSLGITAADFNRAVSLRKQ